jgi:hypothetical protein
MASLINKRSITIESVGVGYKNVRVEVEGCGEKIEKIITNLKALISGGINA